MQFLKPGFSFGGPLEQILPNKLWPKLDSPLSDTDSHFMLEAIKVSLSSVGISNPNPAVGCILVDAQGNEISRGATQAYLGPHAERHAFSKVSNLESLRGATAYVTLEPCSHHGNQPPCVELLTSSEIKRVVIARMDPNPLVSGEGIRKLKEAGKEVSIGLNHAESTAWNFPFFAYQTVKRPIFILKWAQTLDGQLADDHGKSQWITGPAARSYTHWLRQKYDTILVGAETVLSDYPKLTVRDCALPHQAQPLPIVFDPKGKLLEINQEQKVKLSHTLLTAGRKFVYATTEDALRKREDSWIVQLPNALVLRLSKNIQATAKDGLEIIHQLISLIQGPEFAKHLGRPLQSVMIEGGAKTLSLFLLAGYADLLHVFLAPMLSGGELNRIKLMNLFTSSQRFELISNTRLGPDMVMEMVNSQFLKLFK